MQLCQTRSNAIAFHNTVPAICIEKVVYTKSGEELYNKVYQSPRFPRKSYSRRICTMDVRIFPISRREHPATIKANIARSTGKARGEEFEETRSGNIDFRIQGLPHSTVQKEDDVRRETVKRLIHQFETHPKRESLMADLNKTQELNPFSKESQSTSSCVRSLPRYSAQIVLYIGKWALFSVRAANACSLRKEIDS